MIMTVIQGLHQLPGSHVTGPYITHFPGLNQMIKGRECFPQRSQRIITMDLIEIDTINLEPA